MQTLIPVKSKKINESINVNKRDRENSDVLDKNNTRGKRSYKHFISKILSGSPDFKNMTKDNKLESDDEELFVVKQRNATPNPLDDEQDTTMQSNDFHKLLKTKSVDLDVLTDDEYLTPFQKFKSLFRRLRRKGKLRNYFKKFWGSLVSEQDTNYRTNIEKCKLMPTKRSKKVLVVRIPDSLGELPVVVVKDPKNQMLSLSVQVSDMPNNTQFIDHQDEMEELPLYKSITDTGDDSFTMAAQPNFHIKNNNDLKKLLPYESKPNYLNQAKKITDRSFPTLKDHIRPISRLSYPSRMYSNTDFINKPLWRNQTSQINYIPDTMMEDSKKYKGLMKPDRVFLLHKQDTPYKHLHQMKSNYRTESDQKPKVLTQDKINSLIINEIHKILSGENKTYLNDEYYDDSNM